MMTSEDIPLVSIVLPAHNAERYLGVALDSVCAQTYTNWELLAVDDGSRDGTRKMLEDAAHRDPRIRYYHHDLPRGPGGARNTALRHARGGYLTFLDADDWYEPERLARCVELLESDPDYGFLFHDLYLTDADGIRLKERFLARAGYPEVAKEYLSELGNGIWSTDENYVEFMSLHYCAISTTGIMLRRNLFVEVAGVFDEDLRAGEDIDVWFRLALKARGMFLQDCLASYRQYEGSLTTQKYTYLVDSIRVHRRNLERMHNLFAPPVQAAYRRKIARYRGDLAWLYVCGGQWKDALYEYAGAVTRDHAWDLVWPMCKCLVRALFDRVPRTMQEEAKNA